MSLEFLEANLKKGDAYPERKDKSLLRVIGFQLCPYDERVLLVLEAKGIDYERVNVSLQDKPEFLTEKNPLSKVPVIVFDSDDKVLSESLIIIDYIEEVYADKGRRLTAKDPYTRAKHKLYVEHFSQWQTNYMKAILSGDDRNTIWGNINDIFKTIDKFLASKRNGKFLSGDGQPGWIDYVLWPFIERVPLAIELFSDHKYNKFLASDLPAINAYRNEMFKDPTVAKVAHSVEIHKAYAEKRLKQMNSSAAR